MLRIPPTALAVVLFGTTVHADPPGCYPTYTSSSSTSYKLDDWASSSVTATTPITWVQCTPNVEGCPASGQKQEGGMTTTTRHNYQCISNDWCGQVGYAPGGTYSDLAWKMESEMCSGTAPVPAATIPTAWSGGGCPKAYSSSRGAAVVYEPGDVVSVTTTSYTSVYECKAEPYNQFCGMVGFEPGEGQAWKEGWVELGSCSGTLTPTTSPNYDVLEDMGGCPSEFDGSDKYEAGDQVSQDGLVYVCREWPYSEHCSQDGYNPGNPTNNPPLVKVWQDAWTLIGHCSGTITPTISPSYDALPDFGGCPNRWEDGNQYEAGDCVSDGRNLVYCCREWPYSGHCSQDGYDPGNPTNNPPFVDSWRDAWTLAGHCRGSTGPTQSPSFDDLTEIPDGCPEEFSTANRVYYEGGDLVAVKVSSDPLRTVVYECTGTWPFSVYCKQSGFEPGTENGASAWKAKGYCTGTQGPTSAPTPYSGTCQYIKCFDDQTCNRGDSANAVQGSTACSCTGDEDEEESCDKGTQKVCTYTDIKPYSKATTYQAGDYIRVITQKYKCKSELTEGWCNIEAYSPLEGAYEGHVENLWMNAWTKEDKCPAVGGAATSGAATSGAATSGTATSGAATSTTAGCDSFPNDLELSLDEPQNAGKPVTLMAAVRDYVNQGCASDPNCAIGQTWGWPINTWCVDEVTSFTDLFYQVDTFNEDINGWTTSQPLNSWNTANVDDMWGTFHTAAAFNQPLDSWAVDKVVNMQATFHEAYAFNQPLDNWGVGNVNTMFDMFLEASSFNQPLNSWDVSSVETMQSMFAKTAFNQPLNSWQVPQVKNMMGMFKYAAAFNQNLCNFATYYNDDRDVYNYGGMFRDSACTQAGPPVYSSTPRASTDSWCKTTCP